MRLTIAYSKIKKRNLVLINNVTHQRETSTEGPIRLLPLWGVEWVHGLFLFPLVFRENEVATCKIGSFLCSLDNLFQKNVIVFFFGNQISKWGSFEKRAIFDLLFTFFSHQGKVTKIPSAPISLAYIHVFAHPIDFFGLTNFEKNTNLSGTFCFWYDSWCLFLFAPFWNNK